MTLLEIVIKVLIFYNEQKYRFVRKLFLRENACCEK